MLFWFRGEICEIEESWLFDSLVFKSQSSQAFSKIDLNEKRTISNELLRNVYIPAFCKHAAHIYVYRCVNRCIYIYIFKKKTLDIVSVKKAAGILDMFE